MYISDDALSGLRSSTWNTRTCGHADHGPLGASNAPPGPGDTARTAGAAMREATGRCAKGDCAPAAAREILTLALGGGRVNTER